jgi:hypothetical protein
VSNYLSPNLTLLKKRFPKLLVQLEKVISSEKISICEAKSGHSVPQIEESGHNYPFHSLFDPVKEGGKLLKTYSHRGMKIFLGLGGAYQILPFLNQSSLLIIEPDPSLLKELLQKHDYSALLKNDRVTLLCGDSLKSLSQWLFSSYSPLLDGNIEVIPLRSYRDKKAFHILEQGIDEIIKKMAADCSTQKKLGRQWQRNILNSLNDTDLAPYHPSLFENFNEAYIAAAGPGLEQQMDQLRNRPKTSLLLCVDTALPTLLQQDILPDGIITIDPQAIGYLHFMKKVPSSCKIIADWGVPLPEYLIEQTYRFSSYHPLCSYLLQKGDLPLIQLDPGANVTQTALTLLEGSNIGKIVLLGADFSYPTGKAYCRESYLYTWYNRTSSRLGSLENDMTTFVLERASSRGKGKEIVYRTAQMESYEQDFINFLDKISAEYNRRKGGVWDITLTPQKNKRSLIPPEGSYKGLLKEYRSDLTNLSKDELLTPSPLIATLIPLGYSFYENDSTEALKKAVKYSLDLLNRKIS